jgi:hypothetical protein
LCIRHKRNLPLSTGPFCRRADPPFRDRSRWLSRTRRPIGQTTFAVGVDARAPFRVYTLPDDAVTHVVLDIAHGEG